MNIYIGDGSKIRSRIRNQHCSGNVEGSSLRKHVASAMGLTLARQQRENGTWRVRINLPTPLIGEQRITNYLRTGKWKFVVCPVGIEAKDFQFYAIQKIKPQPILNSNQGKWQVDMESIYSKLLNQLINSSNHSYDQTTNIPNEPGVYLFIHEYKPS